jgi:hypothetical protein
VPPPALIDTRSMEPGLRGGGGERSGALRPGVVPGLSLFDGTSQERPYSHDCPGSGGVLSTSRFWGYRSGETAFRDL